MSSARRISDAATCRPSVPATVWTSRISSTAAGLPTLANDRQAAEPGYDLTQKLEPFAGKVRLLI